MTNIYVGNLAQRVTEEEIREAFARFGQVGSIRIVIDQETNRSLGYAFVEMLSPTDAKAAIEAMSKPVGPNWNCR
jgi:RNA recognition motif-containing protein